MRDSREHIVEVREEEEWPLARTQWQSLHLGVEKRSNGCWVPFEGSYGYGRARVASGQLRVALRALDAEQNTPHQLSYNFDTLQPVVPGDTVEVQIPLSPSSTLFRAGDSLRLMVGGPYLEPRNPFFGHFPAHYVPSPRSVATIRWSAEAPSSLEIPVIPAR